jgi:hypothetical protein
VEKYRSIKAFSGDAGLGWRVATSVKNSCMQTVFAVGKINVSIFASHDDGANDKWLPWMFYAPISLLTPAEFQSVFGLVLLPLIRLGYAPFLPPYSMA